MTDPSPDPDPDREAATQADADPALTYMMRCARNDSGNSRRFTYRQRGKLVHATGPGWYRWTGKVWMSIEADDLRREGKAVVKKIWDEARAAEEQEQQKSLASWAIQSGNRNRIDNMIKLAAAGEFAPADQPDLKLNSAGQLDHNRDILNTANGVVDLKTGELLDHEDYKDEYCTRIARVGYDPEADMSGWVRWLSLFWPNSEIRAMLKKLAGASITGYSQKLFVCLIGETDTGKTTFIEAVKSMLGSYGSTVSESTFTNARSNEANYDLATMRGVRLASFAETRAGHGLAAERIKRVTGGEEIKVRLPYEKPFTLKPEFTLWLATNHKPHIDANDDATWKRVRAIPCLRSIPKPKQIEDYAEMLVQEHGPGILRWCVEGARDFYEAGRRTPRPTGVMSEFAGQWRDELDVVTRWVKDRTRPSRRGKVRFPDLWSDFQSWCTHHGEDRALDEYTSQRFHNEMDKHYERSAAKLDGCYRRLGVELLPWRN